MTRYVLTIKDDDLGVVIAEAKEFVAHFEHSAAPAPTQAGISERVEKALKLLGAALHGPGNTAAKDLASKVIAVLAGDPRDPFEPGL